GLAGLAAGLRVAVARGPTLQLLGLAGELVAYACHSIGLPSGGTRRAPAALPNERKMQEACHRGERLESWQATGAGKRRAAAGTGEPGKPRLVRRERSGSAAGRAAPTSPYGETAAGVAPTWGLISRANRSIRRVVCRWSSAPKLK